MAPQALILLTVVVGLPIAWLRSEYSDRRGLRITLGGLAIASSVGVAMLFSMLGRFNYNAWYGGATKQLVDTTIVEIEDGNIDRVMSVLRQLKLDYEPTYENRAHYDELVAEAVEAMKSKTIHPGSRWDPPEFDRTTWVGHWDDGTGFWFVIQDGVDGLEIQRSGDDASPMQNVVLSEDGTSLTFSEGGAWKHELTLTSKYDARHVWRKPENGEVWQTGSIFKLVRARAGQRRFTERELSD